MPALSMQIPILLLFPALLRGLLCPSLYLDAVERFTFPCSFGWILCVRRYKRKCSGIKDSSYATDSSTEDLCRSKWYGIEFPRSLLSVLGNEGSRAGCRDQGGGGEVDAEEKHLYPCWLGLIFWAVAAALMARRSKKSVIVLYFGSSVRFTLYSLRINAHRNETQWQ